MRHGPLRVRTAASDIPADMHGLACEAHCVPIGYSSTDQITIPCKSGKAESPVRPRACPPFQALQNRPLVGLWSPSLHHQPWLSSTHILIRVPFWHPEPQKKIRGRKGTTGLPSSVPIPVQGFHHFGHGLRLEQQDVRRGRHGWLGRWMTLFLPAPIVRGGTIQTRSLLFLIGFRV